MNHRLQIICFSFLSSILWAEGQATQGAAAPAGGLTPFIPLALMVGIFYFLLIRPQQKKQKEHQKFLTELKKGDMIVTQSGMIGLIRMLSDKFVTLEVDEGVCLKILRGQILENAANLSKETQEEKK